jgi:hypothetical protein
MIFHWQMSFLKKKQEIFLLCSSDASTLSGTKNLVLEVGEK